MSLHCNNAIALIFHVQNRTSLFFHKSIAYEKCTRPRPILSGKEGVASYHILKQKSLATPNLVGILLIMKIPVLKMDLKLIAQVCLHFNYPIIVMLD